ncbi:MAG: hypothetical protein HC854_05355 [Flavobacterium sp.]|nr:hypothetical protein [Flavobacterium sp.]
MKKLKRNFRHAILLASLLATVGCEKENLESDENSINSNISNERTASLTFNKSKDILIAQFDGKPDADDIHSVAALGCMLNHSDLSGVNYFAVQGAYGNQSGTFIQARTLYNKVFGAENTKWTDANANKTVSVNKVHGIVKNILQSGGKSWVQEAGQSSFTKLWVAKLIADGISESLIKSNVIVVQHSKWNEDHTNSSDLTYVKQKTTYQPIDDGNQDSGTGPNRGPDTPNYKSSSTSFLNNAINSQNAKAKDFWKTAKDIISASGFNASYSTIPSGGVDFSDCVENFGFLKLQVQVVLLIFGTDM